MTGYTYGESEPTEDCGICGGLATAEFADIGVGMEQIAPFHCYDCGAVLCPRTADGWATGWVAAETPSDRGERVTGFYINPKGHAFEMTFEEGHAEFNSRAATTTDQFLKQGWVRITNLEGYSIDLPPFMTGATRRALREVLKRVDASYDWHHPYVRMWETESGSEARWRDVMSMVSRLPTSSSDTNLTL